MPTGPGDVLDHIRRGRAATRGDIQDLTGLSRMTVAQRVDALLAAGLVIETVSARSTGGRRPRRLRFNVDRGRILAATIETTHTRVALADLSGRILADDQVDVAVANGPEKALAGIVATGRRLLADAGVERLTGIGVSITGPVDPDSGRPSNPPIMPGWDAYPVAERLQESFEVPVLLANDADAAALGEQAVGYPHVRALCMVKVSTGIGSGIVIGGEVYQGVDGGAGDIGHVKLAGHTDAPCQCGGRGCLAAVASGRAIAKALTALGTPATSGRDVGAHLSAGNLDAIRLTQDAGRRIGEALAAVVCILNPAVLLIGGDLASSPLLAGIRETLYPLSLPRATRHLTMTLGTLGADAAIVGLVRMVVDREFSPEAVNAALTT